MNKRVRASGIFLLIGALLLVIAFLLQTNTFLDTALFNAAFVILAVVILNFLWSLLGGEPISNELKQLTEKMERSLQTVDHKLQQSFEIVNDSHATGVVGLSISGKFPPTLWVEKLRNAQQEVDLMGYTLLTWINTPDFEGDILKLVRKGVKIHVLIMDQANPNFSSFINCDLPGTSIERTTQELQDAHKVFENVRLKVQAMKSADSSGDFEVRAARKGLITCNLFRADTEMVVVNYIYWQQAVMSPLILVQHGNEESNLFQIYQKEFDHIWELNR